MRRFVLSVGVCAGLLLSSGASFAQPAPPAAAPARAQPSARAIELTNRYLKAINMEKMMGDIIGSMDMTTMFGGEMGEMGKDEDAAAMMQASKEATVAIMPKLAEQMAPLMASIYTEEELEAMVVFYESPIGQSILAKSPELTKASMDATRALMPAMIQDMFQRYCSKRTCTDEMKDQLGKVFGVKIS